MWRAEMGQWLWLSPETQAAVLAHNQSQRERLSLTHTYREIDRRREGGKECVRERQTWQGAHAGGRADAKGEQEGVVVASGDGALAVVLPRDTLAHKHAQRERVRH